MTDQTEKNLYLKDAPFYDLDTRPVTKIDIPFYLEQAAKIKGNILELACGTGRITIPLAKAGYEIWGIELSEPMIRQFKNKIKDLPQDIAQRIHLLHGDMSSFSLDRKFPLILLPSRSFQLLLDRELEDKCLKNCYAHLAENGYFIIDVANYIKDIEKGWVREEEFFDWENIDPVTGYKIRRTHIRQEIDKEKQIIYPLKIYHITRDDGSVEKVRKRSPWKYFYEHQIKELLTAHGFKIIAEMGTYDGKPMAEGSEFIFICQKGLAAPT